MNILISNGRVVDPANRVDAVQQRLCLRRQDRRPGPGPGRFQGRPHDRRQRAGRRPRLHRPRRAPARARLRIPRHARVRDGGGDGRRRHQPGDPARHRPGARRARPGRDADLPRQEAEPRPHLPGRRAHPRPQGRAPVGDGRAGRGRLRRLLAGQRAGGRQRRADARAAVRRHLRLPRLAAAAGALPVARGPRPRRRGVHPPRPVRHPGRRRDRGAVHLPRTRARPPAPACTSPACRPRPASR